MGLRGSSLGWTRIIGIGLLAAAAVMIVIALGRSSGSTAGAKVVHGSRHADRLVGTNHPDRISGGRGADDITGRGGRDKLFGGRGRDHIFARDGRQDTIDCGPGKDVAIVDRAENGVYDCERVKVPRSGEK